MKGPDTYYMNLPIAFVCVIMASVMISIGDWWMTGILVVAAALNFLITAIDKGFV